VTEDAAAPAPSPPPAGCRSRREAADELGRLRAAGLYRELREVASGQGPTVETGGRRLANFSSNDYLGLAGEPFLREAAAEAIRRFGCGSGASRLISGSLPPHRAMEEAAARFKRAEAALSFSSGYAAAVGAIPALAGKGDTVILDKLCHASLIDGARLSGATVRVFPHNHTEKLERLLAGFARSAGPDSRCMVVTESVFSMDGDRAPLGEIVALAERFGAMTFLDEAHGIGVLGGHGRGLADALGLAGRIDFQMGTLSKALGGSGGILCARADRIALLVNRARSFIYSTAPSPASAAAAAAAIAFLESGEGERRRETLWDRIRFFSARLPERWRPAQEPGSAIVPLIVGDEREAVAISAELMRLGFWVPAIRYPTVARGAARLRVTLSALHGEEEIAALCDALGRVA
jgi:8-amino-7-oxononanoate synthase